MPHVAVCCAAAPHLCPLCSPLPGKRENDVPLLDLAGLVDAFCGAERASHKRARRVRQSDDAHRSFCSPPLPFPGAIRLAAQDNAFISSEIETQRPETALDFAILGATATAQFDAEAQVGVNSFVCAGPAAYS